MSIIGGHQGTMGHSWWTRRLEKEAMMNAQWQAAYSPRIQEPAPPRSPRARRSARRGDAGQPDEVRYLNHHNRPRAWTSAHGLTADPAEKYARGGQRSSRFAADGAARSMGCPQRATSPPVDAARPMAATAAEREARRRARAEAAAAAPPVPDKPLPLFNSTYSAEYVPVEAKLPGIQSHQLSPRNNGKLRDRTSEYRETCIKSLGTVLNYRCGGSVAVWPPTDKTPR